MKQPQLILFLLLTCLFLNSNPLLAEEGSFCPHTMESGSIPPYKSQEEPLRMLDSINYRVIEGKQIAFIKLSDDSIWRWIPDIYTENFLKTWAKRDPIIVRCGYSPGFLLYNTSHPHYLPTVTLPSSSYLLYPTLSSISEEGLILELSDESKWKLCCDFSKKDALEWIVGDRIIIVQEARGDYYLLNLNIPYNTREKIERRLPVTSLEKEHL